jgi:rare lipoprotein A
MMDSRSLRCAIGAALLIMASKPGLPSTRSFDSLSEVRLGGLSAALGAQETRVLTRKLRVTAYCDDGVTASGLRSGVGQCAAPGDLPFGTKIYIPALNRTLIVTDRTHRRFRHNTVDIFMPEYDDCIQFGRRDLECVITLPDRKFRYGSDALAEEVERVMPSETPEITADVLRIASR